MISNDCLVFLAWCGDELELDEIPTGSRSLSNQLQRKSYLSRFFVITEISFLKKTLPWLFIIIEISSLKKPYQLFEMPYRW